MKTLLLVVTLFIAIAVQASPVDHTPVDQVTCFVSPDTGGGDVITPTTDQKTMGDFLAENWTSLLFAFMGFVEIVVRLTPTEKDNSIFSLVETIVNAIIPNRKTTGGRFTVKRE